MSRKLSLPLTLWDGLNRPTVDAVRKRLGGRAVTQPGVGEPVCLRSEIGAERLGVVLFVREDELHVWLDGGVVRRTSRAATRAADGLLPPELSAVARDARLFAALEEGDRVAYDDEHGPSEGALVEKCRFGGLVQRADGVVVGVGFRKLHRASPSTSN
ncbi:MAG: hypothetical protein U0359_02475 [Byssovorax sp.]